MYPNPQAALPLPERPDVDEYELLAADLVDACRSGEPDRIERTVYDWLAALATQPLDVVQPEPAWFRRELVRQVRDRTAELPVFARQRLSRSCELTEARFVVARAHGFLSWAEFVAHLDGLARLGSEVAAYEAAANAVITGDEATLIRLLREHPTLARMRSLREHRATLLHYVSANGVEGYRQVSPRNAVAITTLLLDAGAEVDAAADVYRGQCTTLGLVATSGPPSVAGVQMPLIKLLLERGARMDRPGIAGNDHSLLWACLANGQPEAAAYAFSRGAPIDVMSAAALGELDLVRRSLDAESGGRADPADRRHRDAFGYACAYGQAAVVEVFLDRGMPVDVECSVHGSGHTGLHVAAFFAHPDVAALLLARGANVHTIDKTWQSEPLSWALTGWQRKDAPPERLERFYTLVARLVAAGARVTPERLEWAKARHDPRMLAALGSRPTGASR